METNVEKRLTKYSAITLGIVLATAFVLVQPIQTTSAQVSEEGIPAFNDCDLQEWGFNLVLMESVRSGDVAKTVHMEKEIYHCASTQGAVPLIMEQTIVAEIYENMTTQKIIRTQAEVITCLTEFDSGGILGCDVKTPSKDPIFLRNCDEDDDPSFAARENIVNKGKIVKTVEANKQILFCDLDDDNDTGVSPSCCTGNGVEKKLDRVLFTDIWENLSLLPNDPVVKKEFLGFSCVVVLAEDGDGSGGGFGTEPEDKPARVESCIFKSLGTFVP